MDKILNPQPARGFQVHWKSRERSSQAFYDLLGLIDGLNDLNGWNGLNFGLAQIRF
jgi:hypothetical protein